MLCDENGTPIFPPKSSNGTSASSNTEATRKDNQTVGSNSEHHKGNSADAPPRSAKEAERILPRNANMSNAIFHLKSSDANNTIAALLAKHRSSSVGSAEIALAKTGSTVAQRKRPRNSAASASNPPSSSASANILAVVTSVNDPRYTDPPTARKVTVDLMIGDGSLRSGRAARVVLKVSRDECIGHREQSEAGAALGMIQSGDVVLFHGLAVRRDYGDNSAVEECGKQGDSADAISGNLVSGTLTTVQCELHRPWWKGEESLRPFTRLSRASWHLDTFDGFDNVAATRDEALRDQIERLAAWYRSSHVESDGYAFTSPTKSLVQAMCRRRRLRDIKSPGLLSDVAVRVLSYDGASPKPLGLGGTRARGQRKWGSTLVTARASLSDGQAESDMAAFNDCGRFGKALNTATEAGSSVLITRVKSHRATGRDDSGEGGLSLVPTPETSIVVLTGEDQIRKRNGFVYASQWDGTQTQGTTQTQLPSPRSPEVSETVVVESTLEDIVVCGGSSVSLKNWLSESSKLFDALVDTMPPDPTYRRAILTLDCNSVPQDFLIVEANIDIVETLCGSCPAAVLANSKVGGERTDLLRNHVSDLLRGMLQEKVLLRWTLQRRRRESQWFVSDVMLPVI